MSQPIRSLELAARRQDAEDARNFREALEKIRDYPITTENKTPYDMRDIAAEALKASKGG